MRIYGSIGSISLYNKRQFIFLLGLLWQDRQLGDRITIARQLERGRKIWRKDVGGNGGKKPS